MKGQESSQSRKYVGMLFLAYGNRGLLKFLISSCDTFLDYLGDSLLSKKDLPAPHFSGGCCKFTARKINEI
jgi:hypothetical protein